MKTIYECRDIATYIRLTKAGFAPFNSVNDNGIVWLFEYQPLMKAIIEQKQDEQE